MSKQRTFTEANQDVATALATVDDKPQSVSPMALLQQAVSQNMDPQQLLQLTDLYERWAKNDAASKFGEAISEFQRRCPRIHKERKVNAGPLNYQYASFDDVMREAGPHLAACGLAVSFSTDSTDKGIRVTCRVRHGIHAEDHTLEVPIPDMKVNQTQRYGAALNYAKRYALCAALNIVVTDDVDDDANSVYETIDDQQELEITALIDEKGVDRARFLAWMGVEKITDIAARDYHKAMTALRSKK